MPKTVVALFDDFEDVNESIRELIDRGYHRDDISIIANDADQRYSRYLYRGGVMEPPDESGAAEGAGVGASIGALVGGVGGILAGIGALVIPVIGPVVAAGPLAVALSGLAGAGAGALAGGLTGGLIGALVDLGVPEETAGYYSEGVRRGGTLVAVRTENDRADDVRSILNRHGPVDLAERSEAWQRTGWTGTDQTLYALSDEDDRAFRHHFESTPYARREGYERFAPAYRYGFQMGSTPGFSDRTWEEAESNLRTHWENHRYGAWDEFRGAIHFGYARASERNERDFAAFEDHFRSRFNETPHARGEDYAQFRPAYRFGWNMGTNPRYFEYEWPDIEEDLRQNWEDRYPGTWEEYQYAVREGWEMQRNRAFATPVTGQPSVDERFEQEVIEMEPSSEMSRFEDYQTTFQQHFNSSPWIDRYSYEQYEPAYRYGFDLGQQSIYSDREWSDIEAQARSEWDQQLPGSWEEFRDAVRMGWMQARRGR